MSDQKAQIGVVGLAVMGKNLALKKAAALLLVYTTVVVHVPMK